MEKRNRISGVIKGESSIAYAFEMPILPQDPETEEYLKTLSENYLSFLKKQSKKPYEAVRFGGLRFEEEEERLTFFVAFCPFEQREYHPIASFSFDANGKLFKLQNEKRSRRKPS